MEMDIIKKEGEKVGDGDQPLEATTEEEAEASHYSSLTKPQEDVYAEAFQTGKRAAPSADKGKETEVKSQDNTRAYKLACLILSVFCLILLLVVIFLSTKLQTGSHFCPENELRPFPSTCSLQSCQKLYNIPNNSELQEDIPNNKRACQHCDDDWLPFGGSCYFLSTFRLSWSDSQKNCNSRGGSLAVIKSPEVQKFLTKESGLLYWIGLSRSNQTWTWVDNSRLQTSYWAEKPGAGDCVHLYPTSHPENNWIRKPCQMHTYFICQM